MRNNFRQGIISYQKDGTGAPQFLLASQTAGYVQLHVAPSPTLVTFAHGSADYLAAIDQSNPTAWGPLVGGPDNYLFWDMDTLTGQVTQGITTIEPVTSSVEPVSPSNGLNWFDLNTKKMKVWSTASGKWTERIRVFAGKVLNGNSSQIVPKVVGTQVGLNVDANPGFIMLDSQLHPLRTSEGTFLTTDTRVRIKTTVGTSGVLATPPNAFMPVRAGENLPAMSLVYFSGADTVSLATSDPAAINEKTPVGIVQEALATNQVGVLTQTGDITYDQWDWSANIGKAIYSNSVGQLTADRPAGLLAYRVGFVKNKNTIVFGIDAETMPQVYNASPSSMIISGTTPVSAIESTNGLGERVVTISMAAATNSSAGYLTAAQATLFSSFDPRVTASEVAINTLQQSKANTSHTHVVGDVTGLQAILDGKMAANKLFDDRYSLLNHNHDGRYALLSHTHAITDVTGLTDTLNSKADRFTGLLPISRVYQSVNQSGQVDGGTGQSLADILTNKSNVGHTHALADVINLVEELNNRAFSNHTHPIAQVTGLQTTLNAMTADIATKANINHVHTIAQVTNLQDALNTLTTNKLNVTVFNDELETLNSAINGKADAQHTHTAEQITDLNYWLGQSILGSSTIGIEEVEGGYAINFIGETGGALAVGGYGPGQGYYVRDTDGNGNEVIKATGSGVLTLTWSGSAPILSYTIQAPNGGGVTRSASSNKEVYTFTVPTDEEVSITIAAGQDFSFSMDWVADDESVFASSPQALSFSEQFVLEKDTNGDNIDISLKPYKISEADDYGSGYSPNNGNVLTYQSWAGGWIPAAPTGGGGADYLNDLNDVSITYTPNNKDVLTYLNGSWTSQQFGMQDLWNVDYGFYAPSENDILKWNNSSLKWTVGSLNLANLGDVNVGGSYTPNNNDVLTWSSGSNKWMAKPGGSGGDVSFLNDLSDVSFNYTPTSGQVLTYTGGGWTAANGPKLQWLNDTDAKYFPTIDIKTVFPIACSDETTALTTGNAKVTFRMPFNLNKLEVRASLTTAQTSGLIFTVDVRVDGTSILSTKLTIDNTEKSSVAAAIPAVLAQQYLPDDSEITVDITQVGDGTAKGLKVYLIGVNASAQV